MNKVSMLLARIWDMFTVHIIIIATCLATVGFFLGIGSLGHAWDIKLIVDHLSWLPLISVVLGLGSIMFLYRRIQAHKLRAVMGTMSCALCDSTNVDAIDDLDYECKQCGYDTTMAEEPAFQAELLRFADLKMAHTMIKEGVYEMTCATTMARLDIFTKSGDIDREKYDRKEQAIRNVMEGMKLLQDFSRKDPALFERLDFSIGSFEQLEFCLDGPLVDLMAASRYKQILSQIEDLAAQVQTMLTDYRRQLLA